MVGESGLGKRCPPAASLRMAAAALAHRRARGVTEPASAAEGSGLLVVLSNWPSERPGGPGRALIDCQCDSCYSYNLPVSCLDSEPCEWSPWHDSVLLGYILLKGTASDRRRDKPCCSVH